MNWTDRQRQQVAATYTIMAQMLPVEGRDYTVQFDFKDERSQPLISMTGITPIGKIWVEYCMHELRSKYGASNANDKPGVETPAAHVPAAQSVL